MLPFVEPQFLGLVSHGAGVEHAVVLDDALEPVGPPAFDPVHHVAAVGTAERAGAVPVELRIVADGVGEALLQILERPAAPIFLDRVGEGLAVAGRAMEIDAHRGIARRDKDARVPAIRPAVGEAALRPAVDEEDDRQPGGHPRRYQLPAPHRFVIGAGEAELVEQHRVHLREEVAVDGG